MLGRKARRLFGKGWYADDLAGPDREWIGDESRALF
jgi:hypothetical protein